MVCDPGCFSPFHMPWLWPFWGCPVSGATGYLYIPADATMIALEDLRLDPTGG